MLLAFAILPQPGFVPPSPPAEKATTSQDQTRQASTGDMGPGTLGPRDCGSPNVFLSSSFFLLPSQLE
jgi:hypothetical protein